MINKHDVDSDDQPQLVPVTLAGVSPLLPYSGNQRQQPNDAEDIIQVVTIDEDQGDEDDDEISPLLPGYDEEEINVSDNDDNNQIEEEIPLLRVNNAIEEGNYVHYPDDDDKTTSFADAICQDLPWAIMFWAHVLLIIYLGLTVSPKGYGLLQMELDVERIHDFLQENAINDDDFTPDDLEHFTDFLRKLEGWLDIYPPRVLYFSIVLCCVSYTLASGTSLIFRYCTFSWVTTSLLLPWVLFSIVMVLAIISDPGLDSIIFCMLAGFLVMYIYRVLWPKLHFASINLEIALYGIGRNLGTYVFAFLWALVTILWIGFWFYTTIGLMNYIDSKFCPNDDLDGFRRLSSMMKKEMKDSSTTMAGPPECAYSGPVFFLLLLSLFWTTSFIRNAVQVYVAGVMATWCFDKEAAKGCCSSAVTTSMYRSLVFSSGPIAFGSLLQGVCKLLRSVLTHSTRQYQRDSRIVRDVGDDCRCCCFGLCGLMLDCLSDLLGDILDYFSQWSYVLVGIYGYSYLESGKRVMKIFKNRGWMALITDRLVAFALSLGVLDIGVCTGLISIGLDRGITFHMQTGAESSWVFGDIPHASVAAFIVGFVIGVIMSSVIMSVLQGAVNTLIVCWAESPSTFMENHKQWADKMTPIWSSAFPEIDFDQPVPNQEQQIQQLHPATVYGSTVLSPLREREQRSRRGIW